MPKFTKTVIILAFAPGLLILVSAIQAEPPPGYYLQWSDEFNGNTLNSNCWNIVTGERHSAVNTAHAIQVTNGFLTITTYSEGGTNYTGFIDTKDKLYEGYGYYEASIQFSNAPGNWSAFWLQSPYIYQTNSLDNPTNGVEIDVFEHRKLDEKHRNWADGGDNAIHWNGYDKDITRASAYLNRSLGIGSGFHTYGFLWTTNRYTFFVDGRPTWTTNYLISSVGEYILLTSEVQTKAWAGNVPNDGYPDLPKSKIKMFVDYVRYYAPLQITSLEKQ